MNIKLTLAELARIAKCVHPQTLRLLAVLLQHLGYQSSEMCVRDRCGDCTDNYRGCVHICHLSDENYELLAGERRRWPNAQSEDIA